MYKYLPKAIQNSDNKEARYYLCYAALMGGVCFDNGLLHYTHALEHPLSAMKPDFSHGLGLAILLPAVIKNIYSSKSEYLHCKHSTNNLYSLSSIQSDGYVIPVSAQYGFVSKRFLLLN